MGRFLSEGPPPKLTIIESKASVKGKFNYSSKQKLGGENILKICSEGLVSNIRTWQKTTKI